MWPNPQESENLVIFTGEIFKVKLHFLCRVKMPWNAREEYGHAKYQRADQRIYEPKWISLSFFEYLGSG